ncbi:MAG: hypothetical protein ACM3Q2_15825, partial [Syntrophothermus sp.]
MRNRFCICACFIFIYFAFTERNQLAQSPEWKNYTNGRNIKTITEDNVNLYIGTIGGFIVMDKTTLTPVFYNKSNSGIPGNFTLTIALDNKGAKWLGSRNAGISRFDNNTYTTYNLANSGLPFNWVTSIKISR